MVDLLTLADLASASHCLRRLFNCFLICSMFMKRIVRVFFGSVKSFLQHVLRTR